MCRISDIHKDRHRTDKRGRDRGRCARRTWGWLGTLWSGRDALIGSADGDCSLRDGVMCVSPLPLAGSFVPDLCVCVTTGKKNFAHADMRWFIDGCPPLLSKSP
jgi:hypothetical protein